MIFNILATAFVAACVAVVALTVLLIKWEVEDRREKT